MATRRPHRPTTLAALAVAASMVLTAAGCSSSATDDGAQSGDPAPTTTSPDEGGTFSLLSYNVAGLPAEISKVRPDLNIPIISPLLEPYDVVLTQEDFDWWKADGLASGLDFVNYHDRLRADVTHEHRTEAHPGPEAVDLDLSDRQPPEVGDGLGVLSRFALGDAVRVPWAACFGGFDTSDGGAGDCLSMKGFLHVRMTLADGVEVDLYDLHGEAGGTPTDQELQAADYEQLAAYIVEHSAGRAVVLGGDTNLHTDLEHPDGSEGADIEIWDRFLEETGLTDACTATDCPEPGDIDKVAYRSGDGVELEATAHDFPTSVFVDDEGEALSDHDPLEVVFTWRRA